jgi:peptidoglycan/xylan/chitin deacetylase (PgdA/CDA1 family)
MWAGLAGRENGGPSVVLTFDDGRASDFEVAFPLLLEAGTRAEFFVNTAAIGRPGFLSWRQMAEMQARGMSFQSHGHDHVDLTPLPRRVVEWQLDESKRRLEDRLGSPVEFLAAPYGRLSRRVVEVAGQVGYRAVCTSRSWPARPGARLVDRIAIYRHTTPGEFSRLLGGHAIPYVIRAARATLLFAPKRLLLRRAPGRLGVQTFETST